mmetsp:Transcript_46714/g.130341  ORF Transcript_46714/g.130341 Transcript_46714/m.130341 type:complete len:214 (+) Transcript_46714:522-1163(+)
MAAVEWYTLWTQLHEGGDVVLELLRHRVRCITATTRRGRRREPGWRCRRQSLSRIPREAWRWWHPRGCGHGPNGVVRMLKLVGRTVRLDWQRQVVVEVLILYMLEQPRGRRLNGLLKGIVVLGRVERQRSTVTRILREPGRVLQRRDQLPKVLWYHPPRRLLGLDRRGRRIKNGWGRRSRVAHDERRALAHHVPTPADFGQHPAACLGGGFAF